MRNVRAVADKLAAPLVIEFPGFAEGLSLEVGSLDAYDFFRRVVRDAGVAATLDVGHLLSYRCATATAARPCMATSTACPWQQHQPNQ